MKRPCVKCDKTYHKVFKHQKVCLACYEKKWDATIKKLKQELRRPDDIAREIKQKMKWARVR